MTVMIKLGRLQLGTGAHRSCRTISILWGEGPITTVREIHYLTTMKKIMLRHNRRMFLLKDEAIVLGTGACRQWHIGVGLFLKTVTACRIAYQHHPHT
jgi:hypothetical protein